MADERDRGPLQCWSGRPSEQQDRNAGTAQRVHAVLQAEVVEAQQRGGRRPRCAGSSDPPQAAKLRVRRLRPQRLAAAHDDIQPALQLLAVAGVHPPGTQFFQRHGAADAALAGQQVALYLCATHRGVRQRPRRDHGMGTPTPPAAQPQDRYQLLVQILLVAAVLPQPGAAARRTPHPPGVPAASYLGTQRSGSFPGQYRVSVSYWWKGDRVVSNHVSRSPFFSPFSLTYSKAIISSCFHY